jgi:hypothetical protein
MLPSIIGFSAVAGGGKDTSGDFLAEEFGYVPLAFAAPLKRATLELFPGWTDAHVYGDLKDVACPVYEVTPRWALQTLGTEYGRALIHQDHWARAGIQTAQQYERVVFVDVRFPNEVRAIQEAGGAVIRLLRGEDDVRKEVVEAGTLDEHVDTETGVVTYSPRPGPHTSETALLDYEGFDWVIDNRDATLEELFSMIELVVSDMERYRSP